MNRYTFVPKSALDAVTQECRNLQTALHAWARYVEHHERPYAGPIENQILAWLRQDRTLYHEAVTATRLALTGLEPPKPTISMEEPWIK